MGDQQRLWVHDVDLDKDVSLDVSDCDSWGPEIREEDWDWMVEGFLWELQETLYQLHNGQWVMVTVRKHWEANLSANPEVRRIAEPEARNWIVRNGLEVPAELREQVQPLMFQLDTTIDEGEPIAPTESEQVTTAAKPAEYNQHEPLLSEYLGDGRYQIGDEIICLDGARATVLEKLVELGAANKNQLIGASEVDDAPRVLKDIVTKFPQFSPFITLPGGKGKGGYRTTIRRRQVGPPQE